MALAVTAQPAFAAQSMRWEGSGDLWKVKTEDGTYTLNGYTVTLQFDQDHTGSFVAVTAGLVDVRNAGVQRSMWALETTPLYPYLKLTYFHYDTPGFLFS